MVVDWGLKRFTPRDCSPLGVVSYLALFLAICYFSVRLLEKRGIYLRM